MTVGVGASGFIGTAVETVSGTFTAPTIYHSIKGETLNYTQQSIKRRPLRGIADVAGVLRGDSHVTGTVTVEVMTDQLVHWLFAARGAVVKTGVGPYVYTFTPNHLAVPAKTLSITVVRNGIVFGYTGCVVSAMKFSIDEGILVCEITIVGRDEAVQALPTPTYPTPEPFSPGNYKLEIPTASQVYDADTFEFSVDDSAEPQFRLQDLGNTSARFVKFGERTVQASIERDFESRTDFDAYKALTAQSIQLDVIKTLLTQEIKFLMPAAIKDTYEISGLTGQAELIRASVTYEGTYDATTSKAYSITVYSGTSITIPT
jgi:hypothetical protein